MKGLQYIAAVLTLVGAVSSAQAVSEVKNDQVQFMTDHELNEVVGAKMTGTTVNDIRNSLNSLLATGHYTGITAGEKNLIINEAIRMQGSATVYSRAQVDKWFSDMLAKTNTKECWLNSRRKVVCMVTM
jgi:hypothetical protein